MRLVQEGMNIALSGLIKKRSDVKVQVRRRTAAHRQSVERAGGGAGDAGLTPLQERAASLHCLQ